MATERPPFVLRARRELVYAALLVALLYGAAELAVRIRHATTQARRSARPYSVRSLTHDGHRYAGDEGQIALVDDPHLVYRAAGNQKSAVVTINADGFRGREWRHEKAPGTKRVVVLGGSTAFGIGASGDERVFTARLEWRLDAAARGQGGQGGHVEVWNAGVIGYDSTQELVLLATRLVDVAPDVVILLDGWNDFHGTAALADASMALLHSKFALEQLLLVRQTQPFCELLRGSALFRAMESGLARWIRRHGPESRFGDYHDHSDLARPRYERNLRAIVRLVKGFGATPLLAPQPELFQRAEPPVAEVALRTNYERDGYAAYARTIYPRYVATAAAVAAAESVPFLDCTKAFDSAPDAVFSDFVHLNDRGQELLAACLAPAVERALRR